MFSMQSISQLLYDYKNGSMSASYPSVDNLNPWMIYFFSRKQLFIPTNKWEKDPEKYTTCLRTFEAILCNICLISNPTKTPFQQKRNYLITLVQERFIGQIKRVDQ